MTFVMRCDACGRRIDPAEGDSIPRDKGVFVDLQHSDDPNRHRHYHRTAECWDAIKAAILDAEDAVQAAR